VAAQALGADDEFFAEFTGTQKQYFFHKGKGVDKGTTPLLLSCLTHNLHMRCS
jgi:hypothetical protein